MNLKTNISKIQMMGKDEPSRIPFPPTPENYFEIFQETFWIHPGWNMALSAEDSTLWIC